MARADGSRFWAQLRGSPVDGWDALAGTIWTVHDISEQKQANDELAWNAEHDPLTGLANRRVFEQQASRLLCELPASLPSALLFIDLDHFKPINDQGGHAAGDAMLVAVGAAIMSCVRNTDMVARLGGDEFAVLLAHCTAPITLRTAEHIRASIDAIVLPWHEQEFRVRASIGVARLNAGMTSVAAWLAVADAACYEAKTAGRGVVRGTGNLQNENSSPHD
jgi:diguanylate cyclase (GGDEF)-like protein